jgi:hypothetical protein
VDLHDTGWSNFVKPFSWIVVVIFLR